MQETCSPSPCFCLFMATALVELFPWGFRFRKGTGLFLFIVRRVNIHIMQPWNWKTLSPWKKSYDKPRQHIKKQRHHFADKGPSIQSYVFSRMWELDHKEGQALKNWCFWTVVLEKTLESLLGSKESNQSILEESNPEYSLEGLMLKLKLQYLGPPDAKSRLIVKGPDPRKV